MIKDRVGSLILIAAMATVPAFPSYAAGETGAGHPDAAPPVEEVVLGDQRFRARLEFRDDFATLDDWIIEGGAGVRAAEGRLVVDAIGAAATIWCRTPFEGPLIVQYDVVTGEGARNVNLFAYAQHDEGILETSSNRTGRYAEYKTFPNYVVTYLPLEDAQPWRVRFRKNPDFTLLTEEMTTPFAGEAATISYVFDGPGRIKLYLDGAQVFEARDPDQPYSSGHFGLRTWNSALKYSNFRVYSIL